MIALEQCWPWSYQVDPEDLQCTPGYHKLVIHYVGHIRRTIYFSQLQNPHPPLEMAMDEVQHPLQAWVPEVKLQELSGKYASNRRSVVCESINV